VIYLLDTNACIAILRGKVAVVSRAEECQPDDCGVSTVTVSEGCEEKPSVGTRRFREKQTVSANA